MAEDEDDNREDDGKDVVLSMDELARGATHGSEDEESANESANVKMKAEQASTDKEEEKGKPEEQTKVESEERKLHVAPSLLPGEEDFEEFISQPELNSQLEQIPPPLPTINETTSNIESKPVDTRSRSSSVSSRISNGSTASKASRAGIEAESDANSTKDADNSRKKVQIQSGHTAMKGSRSTRKLPRMATALQQHLLPMNEIRMETYLSENYDTAENAVGVEYSEADVMSQVHVTSLRILRERLINEETERERARMSKWSHFFKDRVVTTIHDFIAAFYIYIAHTLSFEGFLVVLNSLLVTTLFVAYSDSLACKLDFSILSFAVVFPLTFLIQQAYSRRESALMKFAVFRALILHASLGAMTWDWPPVDSSKGLLFGGRKTLPSNFNKRVYNDGSELVELSYEYLSMPTVSHARHRLIPAARRLTRSIHAQQNDLVKRINVCIGAFAEHTEIMKAYGFPAGEASRLDQFHFLMQQHFEELRFLKYYRTPQATRSFGRVYVLILPWMFGPYFAWVKTQSGVGFALVLACFSFLVLLGLLNTQKYLEDPFVEFDNGVDYIKLKYEMASTLQALEMHFNKAERSRLAVSPQGKSPQTSFVDANEDDNIRTFRTLSASSDTSDSNT